MTIHKRYYRINIPSTPAEEWCGICFQDSEMQHNYKPEKTEVDKVECANSELMCHSKFSP